MVSSNSDGGQQRIDSFLREFSSRLSAECGKDIDFILLFGSAARGEFVPGRSDVDLIIQVKGAEAKESVSLFAEKLFWELDEKHKTRLKEVCSIGIGSGLLENLVKGAEEKARLYKPFEVFAPGDIDWKRGFIRRLDLLPGAILVASQLTLLYKMKNEGKILFGRDIRGEINPYFSLWEKLKGILVPQTLAFISISLSLLLPKKAVGYAFKAVFYEMESALMLLEGKIPSRKEAADGFSRATIFDDEFLNIIRFSIEQRFGILPKQKKAFIFEAMRVKKEGFHGGRLEAFSFCLHSFFVIYSSNTAIILKAIIGRKGI